jgi:hypothetical protein
MTEEKDMKNVQTTKKPHAKSTTPAVSEASGSLTLKSKVTENDFRDPRVRALAIAAKSYMHFEIAVNNAFPLLTLPSLCNDLIWKIINTTVTKTPSLEVAHNEAKKSEVSTGDFTIQICMAVQISFRFL